MAWHTGIVSWHRNQRLPRKVLFFKFPEGDPFSTSRYVTKKAHKATTGGERAQFNVIFTPKKGRQMLFDAFDNVAYDHNPLVLFVCTRI
jgi:hypothetical protein